jgi:hypothetical protein
MQKSEFHQKEVQKESAVPELRGEPEPVAPSDVHM